MNDSDKHKLVEKVRKRHFDKYANQSDPVRIMNELRVNVLGQAYVSKTAQDEKASNSGVYSEINAQLERARMFAYVGISRPTMQRFKGMTRLLARVTARVVLYVTQLITTPQRQFNSAIVEAIDLLQRGLIEKDKTSLDIDRRIEISEQLVSSLQDELAGALSGITQLSKEVDKENTHFKETLEALNKLCAGLESRLDEVVLARSDGLVGESSFEYTPDPYLPKAFERLRYDPSGIPEKEKHHLFYSLFENVFYDSDVVQEKQKIYIKYISSLKKHKEPFLDAGCGRGEFLGILKKNNIDAVGVDLNRLEVNALRSEGRRVVCADINQYLQQTDVAYSGISALQVIEHLSIPQLDEFLSLAYSRIVGDGLIVLETINPHAYFGFSRFYMDMTHRTPITPEVLQFKLEWLGFKDVKILFLDRLPVEYCGGDLRTNYQDYAAMATK